MQKETIKEGDSVNLTCKNRCDGEEGSYGYSWFKDGEAINEGPVLHLTNVSSKHSGNYTCSLKMKNGTTSGVAHVDVECEYQPEQKDFDVYRITHLLPLSNADISLANNSRGLFENQFEREP